ncbi:hypothetical protein GGC65_004073 [Sphingopyxis sp. OAS728]|nr:hypothetical protein [Sphingopyxis sp. OAS728]
MVRQRSQLMVQLLPRRYSYSAATGVNPPSIAGMTLK